MPNSKTIAICNQKGGVGKTTTTLNLGVALADQRKSSGTKQMLKEAAERKKIYSSLNLFR